MITYAFLVTSITAALTALLQSPCTPANGSVTDFGNRPITALVLTSTRAGINPTPAPSEFAVLLCNPARGTHPHGEQACKALTAADGNIKKVNINPRGMCPDIYSPITVTAQGWWNGKKVSYENTFGNSCELSRSTGIIFAFSQPAAIHHRSSGSRLMSSHRRQLGNSTPSPAKNVADPPK
ncbi:SSI family serine proteinase inhibitor [Streptomyces noursei]|uniref:SSI family serine proteinase inhibitor n=1 Tax=Streptomyces noursei TaxID=1971 RepID=UPI00099FB0F3